MADTYGLATLPVTPVTDEDVDAISDPALNKILDWAKAVITFECGTAWGALADGETIVRYVHPHNPRRCDFGENLLPALFAYSGDITPKRFEDGNIGRERTIELLWVFPPSTYSKEGTRRAIMAGLQAALHKALASRNGRHVAWVDPDEPADGETGYDSFAATYGSSLVLRGGFETLKMMSARYADVDIDISDGAKSITYPGVHFEFMAEEFYTEGSTPGGSGTSIQTTINQYPSDPAFVQVDIEPNTP